jgi:alpha/beta superfamily hydrolase
MQNYNSKFKILTFILSFCAVGIALYFYLGVGLPKIQQNKTENSKISTEKKNENFSKNYFFEKMPIINGQQTYIAIPVEIKKENPPRIIVFNHGSNVHVSKNFADPFMQQMRDYGKLFTKNNFIFAVSEAHGANWGSQESVVDNRKLIDWLKKSYSCKTKINLIGFSMGGLPSLEFLFAYPNEIFKIALLAPTTKSEKLNKELANKIKNVKIKIWHGDKDVNVPLSLSQQFISLCKKYSIDAELVIIKGVTHWDVDWELHDEILKFFKE